MKNDQHQQARNLYFETELTQAQIAEFTGISEKTISFWANEGGWRRLKKLAKETPMVVIDQMYSEIANMSQAIQAREPGRQYATLEEAEIRRKTLVSIKYIKEQQSPVCHAEVLMNFIAFMRKKDIKDTQTIIKYADNYLRGHVQLGVDRSVPDPYNLPTGEPVQSSETPVPQTPPTPAADIHQTAANENKTEPIQQSSEPTGTINTHQAAIDENKPEPKQQPSDAVSTTDTHQAAVDENKTEPPHQSPEVAGTTNDHQAAAGEGPTAPHSVAPLPPSAPLKNDKLIRRKMDVSRLSEQDKAIIEGFNKLAKKIYERGADPNQNKEAA